MTIPSRAQLHRTLPEAGKIQLSVRAPFNFRYTFWKPSHFETHLEAHSKAVTWRTFRLAEKCIGVRFQQNSRGVIAVLFADCRLTTEDRNRLSRRIDVAYGLSEDLRQFSKLARADSATASAARFLRGMRMSCPESLFEISIISLLLQNTTISRTTQMMHNILVHHGIPVTFDGVSLFAFPSPAELAAVTEQTLRLHCRLGYRAKYLPAFATFFKDIDDEVLRACGPVRVAELLQKVKGVGPYTAGVIASHSMRDFSALSLDVWNTPIASTALFGRPEVGQSVVRRTLTKRFSQFSGLALLYMTEFAFRKKPVVQLIDGGISP